MRHRLDDDQAAGLLAAVNQVGERTETAFGGARESLDQAAGELVETGRAIRDVGETVATIALVALGLAVLALLVAVARTPRVPA